MKFSLPPNTPKGQADAITASENLITVGAGAGTGKTWVLTERYARILCEQSDVQPNQILTLTYTEAAAGEMKTRITERVEELLKTFSDIDRRQEIAEGLADLWVSTIHSFAARLIRESGLSLDIDPRASVITTQQEQAFWDDVAEALEFANLREMAKNYADEQTKPIAAELDADKIFSACVAKWRAGTLSRFARDTAELHASSGRSWQNMLAWIDDNTLLVSGKEKVKDILLPEWQDVWNIFAKIPPLPGPKAKNDNSPGLLLNNLLESRREWTCSEETLQLFYSAITRAKGGSGKPFSELVQYLGGKFSDWRDSRPQAAREITPAINDPLTEQELTMRKRLLKFCALSWAMWDNMKKRRGLLSFSDMINHARTAIDSGAVLRDFVHILVDEFQDTDKLQDSMIESLAEKNSADRFVVGDPKQSIYRFRHADLTLFAQTIEKADRKIELDTSFRTRAGLLAKINSLFASIWRDGLSKTEPMKSIKYNPVRPVSQNTERDSGTMPELMILLSPNSKGSLAQGRKILAEGLARKIAEWVQSGKTIWDKKEKLIRPVKFSDFAVLTPARSIYPVIEEALERFGIKSIQDKSTDYFARGEINDLVCLLRAAADVNDDFAVSGWLMSPFSGVSQADAVKCLTLADKDTKPAELIRRNFPEAYSRLEYYALIGEHEGPAGLIAIFDRDRKWLSCYKPNDRMRVLRNIRLAVHIAREFQSAGTSSLNACAEWLTRSVRNEVSYEEPAWHDDKENAVRLGTVHSAKGLEYPVAVVFDPRTKKKADSSALRPSRELGLVFTSFPDEIPDSKDIKPRLAAWESLLAEQGEEEEQTRLFYVAATRAQDSLIFCGMIDEEKSDSKGEPVPYQHTWTKLLLEHEHTTEPVIVYEIPEHARQRLAVEEEQKTLTPVSIVKAKNSLRQISASSFALYELCPFAWRRSYKQGLSLAWENPSEKAEDYDGYAGGAELGSLVHWILSRWPAGDDYAEKLDYYLHDKEVLKILPGALRHVWRVNDKDTDSQVKRWLMRFAASDFGVKMRTLKGIEREKAFRIPLDGATSLAGAIDALYGNNIIDYKITSIDKTPPGLYESQLDFYSLAVHEMTGAESVNAVIVFLREGQIGRRTVSDFESIRERVSRAAEICACGPYVPNLDHCAVCPFKKGCVKNNARVQE